VKDLRKSPVSLARGRLQALSARHYLSAEAPRAKADGAECATEARGSTGVAHFLWPAVDMKCPELYRGVAPFGTTPNDVFIGRK